MLLLLATNNEHKKREMELICRPHEVLLPGDFGIEFSHDETGTTFLENSMGKARTLATILSQAGSRITRPVTAVIADDSGICADALAGAPGVYTARFGIEEFGRQPTQEEQNQLLLDRLANETNRAAHYTCVMSAVTEGDTIVTVEEHWNGRIARSISNGTGGFGYDPIFIPEGMEASAADMTTSQKHAVSHRGKATRRLLAALQATVLIVPEL
ncbi:MAG: RdgB/HAM1 family non-canonical purine NTP pyrophosphatase [Spirochaetaceae bacterium]